MKRIAFIFLLSLVLLPMRAVAGNPIDEQEMVDFLAVLSSEQPGKAGQARVDSLIDSLRPDQKQLDAVLDWAAKYLLDDRSPIFNPQLYGYYFVMDRRGKQVLDFNFSDTLDNKSSLYTSALADTTVLFFYSADCDHCISLLKEWQQNHEAMPEPLRMGKVIAVCLNDDEALWRQSIRLLPEKWYPVRDLDGLIARRRYDLRILPHIVTITNHYISI